MTEEEARQRTERLRQLMDEYHLKAKDVAAMVGRSAGTVRIWRVEHGDRPIPPQTLELLELKLLQRKVAA